MSDSVDVISGNACDRSCTGGLVSGDISKTALTGLSTVQHTLTEAHYEL